MDSHVRQFGNLQGTFRPKVRLLRDQKLIKFLNGPNFIDDYQKMIIIRKDARGRHDRRKADGMMNFLTSIQNDLSLACHFGDLSKRLFDETRNS